MPKNLAVVSQYKIALCSQTTNRWLANKYSEDKTKYICDPIYQKDR